MSFISDLLINISAFRVTVGNKINALKVLIDGKQNNLTDGLHSKINGNKVDIAFEVSTAIKDKANNDRLIFGNTQATDVVIKGAVVNGDFVVKDSTNSNLFRINGANKVPYFPQLPSPQTGTTYNLAVFDSASGLWKSSVTVADLALASQIPTNYITSNTAQSGLTGDKTTGGNWTFLESSININRTNLTSGPGLRFRTNGLLRWNIHPSNEVSGSNDVLYFSRYDDSGVYVGYSLGLNRQNGTVSTQGGFIIAGQTNSSVLLAGGGHRPVSDFATIGTFMPLQTGRPVIDVDAHRISGIVGGGSNTTNIPSGAYAFSPFMTMQSSTDRWVQLWFDSYGAGKKIRYRGGNNTIWEGWQTMATEEWANGKFALAGSLGSYLPLAGGTLSGALTISPSGSSTVLEQDVLILKDIGTATGNVIPITFEFGTAGNKSYIKGVAKGSDAVNGVTFGFYDGTTRHTSIDSVTGVTSTKFVKTGGTASQFLKADGSVDTNTYALSTTLGSYLPLAGGTMTGVINLGSASTTGIHRDMTGGATAGWARNMLKLTNGTTVNEFGYYGQTTSTYYGFIGTSFNSKAAIRWSTDVNQYVGIGLGGTEIPAYNLEVSGTMRFRSFTNGLLKVNASGVVSVDTNTYALSTALGSYLPLVGGTMSGTINFTAMTALAFNSDERVRFTSSETVIAAPTGSTGEIHFRPRGASIGNFQVKINSLGVIITENQGTSANWWSAYNTALMSRGNTFVNSVNANAIALKTEITAVLTLGGSGNTNFPNNSAYGTFIRNNTTEVVTDFFNTVNGEMWFRTFLSPNQGANPWRKIWHDGNLVNPATQSWVTSQGFVGSAALAGYATLAGTQVFTNVNTFAQSPVIPDATQPNHAVSKQQLDDAVSNTQVNNLFGNLHNYFQDLDVSGGGFYPTSEYFFTLMDPGGNTPVVDVGDHEVNGARLVVQTHSGYGVTTYNGKFYYNGSMHSSLDIENGHKKEFVWATSMNAWREVF